MKGIEYDADIWKDILYLWIKIINYVVNISTLPKVIYRFNKIPVKIPMTFFTKLEQIILKFYGITIDPKQSMKFSEKKNSAGDLILRYFRPYYKVTVVKSVQSCKNKTKQKRHRDQWNRIESLETVHDG